MSDPREFPKPNLLDRAISFVSPERGARRMMARNYLHQFEDANRIYRRGGSGGQAKNANAESPRAQRDAIQDMWSARDLARHDWIGGTLARTVLYILGDLSCRSTIGVPEIDTAYDTYLNAWAFEEDDEGQFACDLTGRHSLEKMAQLACMGMFVDGDHGTVLAEAEDDLRLQLIEADRIGNPNDAQQREDYIRGILLAPKDSERPGRVLGYKVFNRNVLTSQYTEDPNGPFDPINFIHLWDPSRGDQYRGRSILAPILDDCRDIDEWDTAEMIRGKTVSSYAAFLVSKNPFSESGITKWDGKTTEGTKTMKAEWGKILGLQEGEDVRFAQSPQNPSGAFMAYIQAKYRKIAIKLDLPFEFIWDMSPLGGFGSRIIVQQAQRKIRYWQKLMVTRFLRRAREAKLRRAFLLGELPFHPEFRKCKWGFGPWLVGDAGYEMDNDIKAFRMGWASADDIGDKYASDVVENIRENAVTLNQVRDVSAESGIPAENLAPDLCAGITQGMAAMAEPPAPPPEPGSLEAVGDKGAAQIIDLLSKVTQGQLDPESAKLTLVNTYHLDPALAEAIVPVPKPPEKPEPGEDGGDGKKEDA